MLKKSATPRVGRISNTRSTPAPTPATSTTTKWSAEQLAFHDACSNTRDSIVLEAVAGSGKTTTIIEAAITRLRGSRTILAYNNKIAAEIKGKLEKRGVSWRDVNASTVHSLGFRTYRKTYSDVKVDENKTYKIISEMWGEDRMKRDAALIGPTLNLVSLAKQSLFDETTPAGAWAAAVTHFALDFPDDYDAVAEADAILAASTRDRETIDFDDMIYMPLTLRLAPAWRYNVIIIDEAQDTNEARRQLVAIHLAPGGRVIAVGDPHQAIYGFTGADALSIDLIRRQFGARTMTLSYTFRCPLAVVAVAQQYVSHIHAAPGAAEGMYDAVDVPAMLQSPSLATSAVLSRTTRPLVALAFRLIRQRVPCRIEGRDIGGSLRKLATKWKSRSIAQYDTYLANHLERAQTKLKNKPRQLQIIEDSIETLKVIMSEARLKHASDANMSHVVAAIDELFADNVNNMLTLSTIHKSKGREWDNVYVLDRHKQYGEALARCNNEWQADQELNLQYVCCTRAVVALHELSSDDMAPQA